MTSFMKTRTVHVHSAIALGLATLVLASCDAEPEAHPLGHVVDTAFYSLAEGVKQGPGTVAVTDVRTGELVDLVAAGSDVDADPDTRTPLYVDITFANTGDVPVDLREPSGVDSTGNLAPSLTVIEVGETSRFDQCPALPDTLEPGASVDGCSIVLVPESLEIERISYLADTSGDFEYWEVP